MVSKYMSVNVQDACMVDETTLKAAYIKEGGSSVDIKTDSQYGVEPFYSLNNDFSNTNRMYFVVDWPADVDDWGGKYIV